MYLVRLGPHMNAKGIASASCRLSQLCRLCFIAALSKRLGEPIPAVGSARVLALPTGWRRQLDMNIVRVRHAWACRIARRVVFAKRPMAMLRVVLPGDKHLDEVFGRKELELCEKRMGVRPQDGRLPQLFELNRHSALRRFLPCCHGRLLSVGLLQNGMTPFPG